MNPESQEQVPSPPVAGARPEGGASMLVPIWPLRRGPRDNLTASSSIAYSITLGRAPCASASGRTAIAITVQIAANVHPDLRLLFSTGVPFFGWATDG